MSFDLELLKKLMKPIEGKGGAGRLNEQKQLNKLLKEREEMLSRTDNPRTILHPR
jgi:hypothetical protein